MNRNKTRILRGGQLNKNDNSDNTSNTTINRQLLAVDEGSTYEVQQVSKTNSIGSLFRGSNRYSSYSSDTDVPSNSTASVNGNSRPVCKETVACV